MRPYCTALLSLDCHGIYKGNVQGEVVLMGYR